MKVLIANRKIAGSGVTSACRHASEIGTVAVYSEADSEAMHVHQADEAICIVEKHCASPVKIPISLAARSVLMIIQGYELSVKMPILLRFTNSSWISVRHRVRLQER